MSWHLFVEAALVLPKAKKVGGYPKRRTTNKVCQQCGMKFETKTAASKFCCTVCREEAEKTREKRGKK